MNNQIYAVYDRKAQYYLPPFTARGDAEAIRSFTEVVVTGETPLSQYPSDFDLVKIGSFHLETGVLSPENIPVLMLNGLVALTDHQRQRSRYQSVLGTIQQEEPAPEAS